MKGPGFGGAESQTGLRKSGRYAEERRVTQLSPERCQPLTNFLHLSMDCVQRVQGCFLWKGERDLLLGVMVGGHHTHIW